MPPAPLGVRIGVDRAGVAERLGPREGGAGRRERDLPARLAEGLNSCLAGQLVGGRGHGAARGETLASGQPSSQIRPR